MASLRGVLVTGASRGIGRAVAERLLAEGPTPEHLVLGARGVDELELAAEALRAQAKALGAPTAVHAVPLDVRSNDSVEAAVRTATELAGVVDGLVLNAGIAESAPLVRTDDALLARIFEVNVFGAFRVLRAVLPGMLDAGFGRVVAVGSIASKGGYPYISAYCASKHALLGMVRSAARELVSKGITVNAVCPGYVDTPMTRRSVDNIVQRTGRSTQEAERFLAASSPLGRLFQPEEIAAAIAFLLRPESGGITGIGLDVDGGESAG